MTNDLQHRMHEHRSRQVVGLPPRYHADRLVWFESTSDVHVAIGREKHLGGEDFRWTFVRRVGRG